MTDLLFVYGTLMRAAHAARLGADMRARLDREATWLGPATMAGRLFDLGRYPAMTKAVSAAEQVRGEVYRLRDADAVFRWLDPYEGIAADIADPEYARVVQPALLTPAQPIEAWVYLYLRPVTDRPRLPGGSWRPRPA